MKDEKIKNAAVLVIKYHGPSNTKGSRVSVTTISGLRKYYSWDYSLNEEENYIKAAKELIKLMPWSHFRKYYISNTSNGAYFIGVY